VDLTMALSRDAVLLRIFIGEDDKADHRPLYEAIVLKAREMHLAGATVLRGPMGFGHSSVLHTTKIVRLSQDLPLVIEIVDSEEKINGFVDAIEGMMGSALAHYIGIAAFSETDQTEDLKAISVPVLVTQGDDDQVVPYKDASLKQHELLKDSTLKIYEGYPHGMLTIHADVINPDLLDFIKQ